MTNNIIIPSKCWYEDNWVEFNLQIDEYENIIDFLYLNKLDFLANMNIDFDSIPISLHGRGRSKNLLDYLANNTNNISLIKDFIQYFIFNMTKIKYFTGEKLNYNLSDSSKWQTSKMLVSGYLPDKTTTTTTTFLPTTTILPTTTSLSMSSSSELFEIFGQLYNV